MIRTPSSDPTLVQRRSQGSLRRRRSGEWSEAAWPLLAELEVLTPPYRDLSALERMPRGGAIGLGSVIVAPLDVGFIDALAGLTLAAERWPWAVPYLAVPLRLERLAIPLRIVSVLRDRLVIGGDLRASPGVPSEILLEAVRRRGVPSAELLAGWIAARLRVDLLEPILFSQFRAALEGSALRPASASTYSRFFARLGRLTARDWRAIARLCAHVSAAEPSVLPMDGRISGRTAAEYARKYLGVSYHELAASVGWEWILEHALRRAKYV